MPIPYFDAHCDTIHRCQTDGGPYRARWPEAAAYFDASSGLRKNKGHIDLERAAGFARYAQVFALYQDPELLTGNDNMEQQGQVMYRRFLREMEENADRILPCRTGAEVDAAVAAGKAAALLSMEGADLIGCDPERVATAARWGVRFLNPVWNWPNVLSGTNCRDTERGLSPRGADFLRQLEEHDIYPDVSHISDPGFWDIIRLARRPVVATHSNSRALCPHPRNLTDDMFRAIRDSGGVVGLNLYRDFVGDERMETLLRHVEHFLELGGEKTLCIGGDLDGCEALAGGMAGLQDIPRLWQALEERGYARALLEDIFWGNLRRIL